MAAEQTPYEIAIVETTPDRDLTIVQVVGEVGLADVDAIALARQRLQDMIDLIDENPSLLVVRKGIITTPAYNTRLARRQDELSQ